MMIRPAVRRLSVRLLAFNLLLLFLPLASLLYLDTYERQLLEMQEASMIQQARIMASAIGDDDPAQAAPLILRRLGTRVDSRIRVVNRDGLLLADSSAPSIESTRDAPPSAEVADRLSRSANETTLYRSFVAPLNALRALLSPPGVPYDSGEYYSGRTTLLGPEVLAALQGRYGAITRLSTGGQVSVNLYSAIPILGASGVTGAVLVSRSTYGILEKLYELRLDIIKIFLFSLLAALVLSIILSMTITVPVARLTAEADTVLDPSGRFQGHFTGMKRRDEIGDLSRALSELSGRLEKRVTFIDGFTADLLHELKNPLAAIRGAVELALDAPESSTGQTRPLLVSIRDEELRMERLLSRLREIGRLDNDMAGEPTELVDLSLLIPVILARYPHKDFPSVGVDFIDETTGNARIRAHPDRLVQALVNPVDNAISFSPSGARVVVRLCAASRDGAEGYRITVDDSGPGVGQSSLPHVFDRFYSDRPARPAQATDDHAGLGLAIVKAIATAYDGSCTLKNLPGRGCRFELWLPATSQ
ncbi:MAG: sensor N-terminal transmembrane domain-containing protein, partial [Spirochaetales bacterium]|nr:sensor N-terminal transmembrane domain-containing protein [Spirochaetales bacterium]